jgi:hypothetical protein
MGGNFAQDQAGMHTQLAALRQLVQVRLRDSCTAVESDATCGASAE